MNKLLFGIGLGVVVVGLTSMPAAQPAAVSKLYVTNSAGNNIHIIDLRTFRVIGEIKTGDHPHGAAAAGDGRQLFTTVESDNPLRIIDTATDQIRVSIKLTDRPNQCAVKPDGRLVGVPIRGGDNVDIVDVAQRRIVKNLPVKFTGGSTPLDTQAAPFQRGRAR